MEFTATESGFKDGLGGASNATAKKDYHYVLFGRQTDNQHPENSGVYFEFDDQIHGSVNSVASVMIGDGLVEFELKDRQKIIIRRGVKEPLWRGFLEGICEVFPHDVIRKN